MLRVKKKKKKLSAENENKKWKKKGRERLLRRVKWAWNPLTIGPGVVVATEPAYTI